MNDLFDQRLRNVARSLPTPEAPSDLIDRVMAERAAGERIVLPSGSPRRARRSSRVTVLAVAASVILAAAIGISRSIQRPSPSTAVADTATSSFTSGFFISPAFAQTPPRVPGAPPIAAFNAKVLDGRQLEYRIQFVDSAGRVTPNGIGKIVSARAQYEGTAAFRVLHTATISANDDQPRALSETLFVDATTLRLLARSVTEAPYSHFSKISIRQRFVGDSVLGEMRTDSSIHRPIAHRLTPTFAPYISDALAPLALSGVTLSSSWRGSLSVVGWAVRSNDVFYPVTLWVVGEETLATANGPVPCWKLRVSAPPEQRVEWVRKSDGIAIKSRDDGPPTPKGRREFVLVNP